MECRQKLWIGIILVASFASVVWGAIWWCRRCMEQKRTPEKCNRAGISAWLILTGFLAAAIFALRLAVGYHSVVTSNPAGTDGPPLTVWEKIFSSILEALRTFSMEEEYSNHMVDLRNMLSSLVCPDWTGYGVCEFILLLYASVLDLAAPIFGGAVILEIVSSMFPQITLRFSYLSKRTKCFFSELNPATLALAKSLYENTEMERPILIFTDTYIDDEKEKDYELLLEAKKYGAICVRDDLAHVVKPKRGQIEYYLMDENEFGNLQTLMGLTEGHNVRYLRNSQIYLFVQSDAYVQIEKQVNRGLDSEENKKLLGDSQKPRIVPVHGYRNLVHNLFSDVPLYEPLVGKADPTKLCVTILGNGIIGTEAFLSAYWFGQMAVSRVKDGKMTMDDVDLTIQVISQDKPEDFWSKIDYINPEIRETVTILSDEGPAKAEKNSRDLLVYMDGEEPNAPYCKVRYIQQDVKIGGLWDGESKVIEPLLQSDYVIVALGNDADNISIAEKMRCAIGKKHLEAESAEEVNNVVVAYAVFDPKLAKTLNGHKRYQTRHKKKTDVYMHAFGSLDQVYSCDNIKMSKSKLLSEEIGNTYAKAQLRNSHIKENEKRSQGGENGNYNYWSDLARAAHNQYKVFCLGWIKESVFSADSDMGKKEVGKTADGKPIYKSVLADNLHQEYIMGLCKQYKRIAIAGASVDKKHWKELEDKKHVLAWLEHRRWNAFARTMGYQYESIHQLLKLKNEQKDMSLKLHACLVEARRPELGNGDTYICAEFAKNGRVDSTKMLNWPEEASRDRLDQASWARKSHITETKKLEKDRKKRLEKKYKEPELSQMEPDSDIRPRLRLYSDFKEYDYYRYDFGEYLSVAEMAGITDLGEENIRSRCLKGQLEGAFRFDESAEWYIPFDTARNYIGGKYRMLDRDVPRDEDVIMDFMEGKRKDVIELYGTWFLRQQDDKEEIMSKSGGVYV